MQQAFSKSETGRARADCSQENHLGRNEVLDALNLAQPGIIAYLTAGDPSLATTRDIALAAIDNGADVIEPCGNSTINQGVR